jgi:hypothetical protein
MREIGRIKQVQIQRASLKFGERTERYYDPAPLLVVDMLTLSPDGAFGSSGDGGYVIDVHHVSHPGSRNRGDNWISVGFTSHYREMRARFGNHLTDGCAGENILVDSDSSFTPSTLGERLAIKNASTGQNVLFAEVIAAPPCVEFSQFAARQTLSPEQTKEILQFLGNGMRGFYARLDGETGIVRVGDTLYAIT